MVRKRDKSLMNHRRGISLLCKPSLLERCRDGHREQHSSSGRSQGSPRQTPLQAAVFLEQNRRKGLLEKLLVPVDMQWTGVLLDINNLSDTTFPLKYVVPLRGNAL